MEVTYIDSDEALWQRVHKNKSGDFDVFAVNTAELQRYIQTALVRPIDTRALSNLTRQLPRFRDLKGIPGIVHSGGVFAIPYTYSEMGLIYDREQIKTPPNSIKILWDPKYRESAAVQRRIAQLLPGSTGAGGHHAVQHQSDRVARRSAATHCTAPQCHGVLSAAG